MPIHERQDRDHGWPLKVKNLYSKLKVGLLIAWNHFSYKSILRLVDNFKPDIVHVHNTFPLISPSIFYAVRKKAAIVLTLYNYRLFCSNAKLLRSGKICTKCPDERSALPAIRYGCYRESRIATIPLALKIAIHRKLNTWKDKVDAFISKSLLTCFKTGILQRMTSSKRILCESISL